MRKVGKDHDYTDRVLSKRALEIAEQELKTLNRWLQEKGSCDAELGQYLHERLKIFENMIEQKFYSIEELRRDNDPDHYQLTSAHGVPVSDHAAVRYLQRVMGVDLKELAKEIVPEHLEKTIKGLGTGRVSNGDTVLVFKNKTIITVLTKSMARAHRMKTVDVRRKVKRKNCNNKKSKKRRYG